MIPILGVEMDRELQHLARQFLMHGAITSEDFACDIAQIILSYRKKPSQMLEIASKFAVPAGGDGD